MTAPTNGFLGTPVTLTVKKGASTASVSLSRYPDGTIRFTDSVGNKRQVGSENIFAKRLFDAISVLV